MSKYNHTYNLGQFNLELHTDNKHFVEDFDSFLHRNKDIVHKEKLVLNVENSNERLQQILAQCSGKGASFISGYMKTPLRHIEDDNFVYNYDEKRNIALAKDKSTGEITVVYDENTSSNYSSVPMYIAREMTIRKNENLGNHILHSACVSVGDKAYAIVGGPGAGKTSLLLALLKGGQGKVEYVSNDINFITPDIKTIYPFQIPMLLSSATADSYFKDDKSAIQDAPIISYFHEKDQAMITKYKLNRQIVEDLFNVESVNGANLSGIIIPNFSKNQKGFNVQVLSKDFAKDLIASQVLPEDDRFSVDYLGLSNGNHRHIEDALDNLVDNTPITLITYGKDVFESENVEDIVRIFDYLKLSDDSPFELHSHTTASDGILPPEELINIAYNDGIKTLAITDHNTMEGYIKAKKHLQSKGIKGIDLISAIELDACDKSCLHILGYGIEDVELMQNFLKHYDDENKKVYLQIISNLQSAGVDITPEKVLQEFGVTELSKQRIGNYLIKKGYASNTTEVTAKYLGKHCSTYVPRVQPTAMECIDIIHKCGGVSVLAHPMELMKYNSDLNTGNNVLLFIMQLQDYGLDGVECCTPKHTSNQEMMLMDKCQQINLIRTLGNDYHGKPDQKFGCTENRFLKELLQLLQTRNLDHNTLKNNNTQ